MTAENRCRCPIHFVLKKAAEETPVVEACELIFEDQSRRIFPNGLEEVGEFATLRVHVCHSN